MQDLLNKIDRLLKEKKFCKISPESDCLSV